MTNSWKKFIKKVLLFAKLILYFNNKNKYIDYNCAFLGITFTLPHKISVYE